MTAHVLVVDDDDAWRAALAACLEQEGFRVIGLSRGDEVASTVETYGVDIVILDLHLPALDGLEVLGVVRHRWPRLPVIMMTAFGGADTAKLARRRGATGYLEKPFRMAELIDELRRIAELPEWQPDRRGT